MIFIIGGWLTGGGGRAPACRMDLGGFAPPASPMRTERSAAELQAREKNKVYFSTTRGITSSSNSFCASSMKLIVDSGFTKGGAPSESWSARAPITLASSNLLSSTKKTYLFFFFSLPRNSFCFIIRSISSLSPGGFASGSSGVLLVVKSILTLSTRRRSASGTPIPSPCAVFHPGTSCHQRAPGPRAPLSSPPVPSCVL